MFLMPASSGSLVMAIQRYAKYRIHVVAMLLFYILQKKKSQQKFPVLECLLAHTVSKPCV